MMTNASRHVSSPRQLKGHVIRTARMQTLADFGEFAASLKA